MKNKVSQQKGGTVMYKKVISVIMVILMFASFDTFVVFAAEPEAQQSSYNASNFV